MTLWSAATEISEAKDKMRLKKLIPQGMRDRFSCLLHNALIRCLKSAAREHGLDGLIKRLRDISPDISQQYSTFRVDNKYMETKIRNMHAFQISLLEQVIGEFANPSIVDIGDSSGTHAEYILGLYRAEKDIDFLSVNLDAQAVEKIRKKGIPALQMRAEDLQGHNIQADILLCFETLEHLTDPSRFLYQLSTNVKAKYLVITVPYLKKSRVGLHHIRSGQSGKVYAENTHIFELSPDDWKLIIWHSGWEVTQEKIYLQYTTRNFYTLLKGFWRKYDFEGFYGLILKKNDIWSSRYTDW